MNKKFGSSIIFSLLLLSVGVVAQTKFEPLPDNIKVAVQPESPVQITLEGIYPSAGNYRMFGYTLRNTVEKEVRAMNIRTDRDGVTNSFSLGWALWLFTRLGFEGGLKRGGSEKLSYPVTGYDGKLGGTTLSVDFVLFRDGTSWGPDLAGQSEWLLGVFDGQEQFLSEVKKLFAAKDDQGLRDMIMRDGPPLDQKAVRSEDRTKRQIGIVRGYGVARLAFQSDLLGRGDLNGVPARIRDMEREIGGISAVNDNRKQFTAQYSFKLPLKFVGVSRNGQNLAFDERFIADGDWVTGAKVKIKNESDKTIKFVSLMINLPETMNLGYGMSSSLHYGPHPITHVENVKHPRIGPGQTFEMIFDEERPGSTMRFVEKQQHFSTISRVQIELNYVEYDDGTRWSGGQWQKQDPENPKRWIPVKPDPK